MGYLALCSRVIAFSNRSLPLVNFRSLGVAPNCTLILCSSLFYRVLTFNHCLSLSSNSFAGFMICEYCPFKNLYSNPCGGWNTPSTILRGLFEIDCLINQCCQLIYIYTKFENFGICSKCLLYKFLGWYMKNLVYFSWRVYLRLQAKLFVILQKANRETQVDFKLHIKPLVILFNVGVSVHFGKRKTRLEESWEVLKKLSLALGVCF